MAKSKAAYTALQQKNKRKSEMELLADAVEKLQTAAMGIYDLGVSLRTAFGMTNLTPKSYMELYTFYEGRFEDATTRSAFRSACWRMKIQDGVDDAESCYVHVLLGPYQGEPNPKEEKYAAWLKDFFLIPFKFKRLADEPGQDAGFVYWVYQTTMPLPRAVLEEIRGLLCVNRPEYTAERETRAFALLAEYCTPPTD